MKNLVVGIGVFFLLLGCKKTASSENSTEKDTTSTEESVNKKESDTGWQDLFNGKDLDGWIVYGTEKWYVDEDGTLVCESGPDEEYGYLGTERKFKDFELKVQFKQEADGNSGVFFHSSFEGTKVTGWQAEVAPPGDHTGGIYESYGRGWLIQPKEDQGDVKMGEWNDMTVRVKGNLVETWLNGEKMISLNDEKIGESDGQIALQIHDGGGIKVRWRNIKIKPL